MNAADTLARAEARLADLERRSTVALVRVLQGLVKSPAYAQRLARELEEAQANVDFARADFESSYELGHPKSQLDSRRSA